MTPHHEATFLPECRNLVRKLQLAVYRMGMSGRYHIGKARDMINDIERLGLSTDVLSAIEHQQRLPCIIAAIERLDTQMQAYWEHTRKNDDVLVTLQIALNDACDALHLKPQIYERLVRQSDKPLLEEAKLLCNCPTDAPNRVGLENRLRMKAENYVRLEFEIDGMLAEIDRMRDLFAEAYREFVHEYVQSTTGGDRMSFAAGFLGLRRAVNTFDERCGYQFIDYATPWIDRELSRLGKIALQALDEREPE